MVNQNGLCTICARGGSKGVTNKNIRELLGKPLIAYSIEQAIGSGLFEHVVVSTDSNEIADISRKYGAEIFFKRPAELASDFAAKLPVIRHAFLESERHYHQKFDFIVDLDATSPLRSIEDIQNAVRQFINNDNDNLITAMPARRSPYFNLVEINDCGQVILSKQFDKPIVRRQDAPKCFDMNASIYIWKREILLTQNTLFLENTGLYVMPEEKSIDIDGELDFKIVEMIMRQNLERSSLL